MRTAMQIDPRALLLLFLVAGCGAGDPEAVTPNDREDDHAEHSEARSLILNEAGRKSLGLGFGEAVARPRGPALDFPGSVEPTYDARHVASAPLAGRIELVALPLTVVDEGALLFRIDAPGWRELQSQLASTDAEVIGLQTWLHEAQALELAHERHEEALSALEERWRVRLDELEAIRATAGGQAAALVTAQAALLDARARLSEAQEVGARLAVDRSERVASRTSALARKRSLLARASTLTGASVKDLSFEADGAPLWAGVDRIDVRARRGGLVDVLLANDGAWADAGSSVLELRRTDALCVHAAVWQADLPRVPEGAVVTIRPAAGPVGDQRSASATLRSGLTADPRERSAEAIALFDGAPPAWARPGLAVRVEVAAAEGDAPVPAVPLSAVRRDGVERIVWVENPDTPSQLIGVSVRVVEESDGWAWIESPIEPGYRVVVRGAGRLLLAVRGGSEAGGHFHADGTFHAEDD